MKKILSLLFSLILAVNIFTVSMGSTPLTAEAADYATELRSKGFPESYIDDIVKLHKQYPNWIFKPLKTGLDWSAAVAGERKKHNQQLIEKNAHNPANMYCNCSQCYKNGNYVIQEASNWVSASQYAVEYYMDPRNWLNEKGIFQFESTSYNGTQTINGIETILKGTWMHDSYITYKDKNGKTQTIKKKYSSVILNAANSSGMSAYYLASKIRQEVGGASPTAAAASGTHKTYPGIYNYYNIGAYDGATSGLRWAATASNGYFTNVGCYVREKPTTSSKSLILLAANTKVNYIKTTVKQSDGYKWYNISVTYNGKSYTGYIRSDLVDHRTSDTYNRPWTDPEKSILNGAKYIARNFKTQNTGYLQKFNVNPNSDYLHSNEYMANVAAAAAESATTYTAYKNAGIMNITKTFEIPVFNNMPNDVTPVLNRNTFTTNGTVQKPSVTVKAKYGNELTYNKDFTLTYSNNNSKNVGRYTVTVNYIGNYKGLSSKTFPYYINPKPTTFLSSAQGGFKAVKNGFTLTWNKQTSQTTGYQLQYATKRDFSNAASVWIENNTTTTKTITGRAGNTRYYVRLRPYTKIGTGTFYGNWDYEGNYIKSVVTLSASSQIGKPTAKLNTNVFTTNGKAQKPTVTATDSKGNKLANGIDYTVTYSNANSTNVGRYTVTVKYIGDYSGNASQTFPYYINPKPTTFLSSAQGGFKAVKNGFTLTWNKQTSQTTGYQLQYATKRDFSNAASVWIENNTTTTKTITGRAGNTRYYVRLRPYTKIGTGTFYGNWDYEGNYIKSVVTL